MKYFLDTEFMEDGRTIELISIGVVADDGRELYLESAEAALENANDFVDRHVIPKLGPVEKRVSRAAIREALVKFVGDDVNPLFVAYYAAYDWLCVCQLFGTMMELPKDWPRFCLDLRQLMHHKRMHRTFPVQDDSECHNALGDARWLRKAWLTTGDWPWHDD